MAEFKKNDLLMSSTRERRFLYSVHSMDLLKAEIASKRKAVEVNSGSAGRPSKYMRRGDIERLCEEQEQKAQQKNEAARHNTTVVLESTRVSFDLLLLFLSPDIWMEKSHPQLRHEKQNLRNRLNHLLIFLTKRRSDDFVPGVNLFDYLGNRIRTAA